MALLSFILTSLLLSTFSLATPTPPAHRDGGLVGFPPYNHHGILCGLPIPIVQKLLCPRQGSPSLAVNTPLGTAHGAADGTTAIRFAVKYADVQRWQESTVATNWTLPNGSTDPTALPLACVQDDIDDSAMSEDCLSMILYVPTSINVNSKAPTMVWIHGGSFVVGSATGPGLDGSNLAAATNSIVAVIQYRLGVLGFFPPNGDTNLGVKDAINSLKFLQNVIPSFGGDASQITVAGQSAGASLIRALLSIPSASSLFKSAIIQSDTMDYGFLSTTTQETLFNYFAEQIPCSSTSDTACWDALTVDQIVAAQDDLADAAFGLDASAGQAEPIRPVTDGTLITTTLDSSTPFPAVSKSLLVSTVHHEAGFTIYGGFSSALDPTTYAEFVASSFNTTIADQLLANQNYAVPASDEGNANADVRPQLEQMGTDQVWRCPTWTFARSWTEHGGKVYLGEYMVGASYPGNGEVPFCTESGIVCHQDDIEIVFGTVPSPSAAQSNLTKEIQARYSSFLRSGIPNAFGYANWPLSTTSDVHAIQLGGSGEAPVGACDPTFWGDAIPYDYQTFDI
ncbi:hypothetical protein EUX98_g5362 [Antrodiella citrinella]|uniref:Carboxylic ester hydrolase n=1 Tax=Antrodiella citrinella TaxID=2447956 RepID=A0A4S4MRL6_9APHY|nr:hypothetical protein EUX98_g5362 [Antrodiella citrinella]